jgi:hypothetical protein
MRKIKICMVKRTNNIFQQMFLNNNNSNINNNPKVFNNTLIEDKIKIIILILIKEKCLIPR